MARDDFFGLDQVDIYCKKAEDTCLSSEVRSAWQQLAEGLSAFNEDEPDRAIERAHQAAAGFRKAGDKEGDAEALLLVTRALSSTCCRKEADRVTREHLRGAREAGDQQGEAKALLALAEVNCDQRGSKKRDEANVAGKAALSFFKELGDIRGVAASLLVQSYVAIKDKSPNRELRSATAIAFASEALEFCQQAGDVRTEAACLHAVASAYDVRGHHWECIRHAEEALDLYLEMGDPYSEAFELCCLAQWCSSFGRLQATIDYAEDALEILRGTPKGSPSQELKALQILSKAHQDKGDKPASEAVAEALKRFQQTDNHSAEAAAIDMLLRGHCEKQEFEQALQIAERAKSAYSKLGDKASNAAVSVLMAGLHLKLHRPDDALKVGLSAMEDVRQACSSKQKSDLMMTIAQAHLERGEPLEALQACQDSQSYCSQVGDAEGEAEALLATGSLYVMQDNLEEARAVAVKAQLLFSEEGNANGEGRTLRVLADIYAKQEQHKAAIRAGERSRALLRGEESALNEASILFTVAQECVQLAVIEGARVRSDKPLKRAARDALEKADKYAKTAIKLCSDHSEEAGIADVLGSSLCAMAQVKIMKGNLEEGLDSVKKAQRTFSSTGNTSNQASACLLAADVQRAMERYQESQREALEAIRCFKLTDPVDEKGLQAAQQILDDLKQQLAPAPQMPAAQAARFQGSSGPLPGQLQLSTEDEAPREERVAARGARPTGGALDVRNLSPELVQKKLLEHALAITGADDGEIEADTPLMEAGLTSTTAIGLRDELTKDLPGINLPVTLVFDYPSVSAMTELVMESVS
eukprot:TRINITY_DN39496_c0_g1_i1.p1 TRINITY_DN39496_c0_g1~~TRINITY_DN39496_c0_g1_i1.p1  ORF type:complete len:815 (+),score=228.57 TRINITY_DN39496_c0_g1_i1:34-2478(+)